MQVNKLQAEKDPWGGGVLGRAAAMLQSLTERNRRGEWVVRRDNQREEERKQGGGYSSPTRSELRRGLVAGATT